MKVVVVGGGIIGCATAYELAKAGCAVTVFERSTPGAESSGAAAGDRADVVDGQRGMRALHRAGADGERDVDAVVDDQHCPGIARRPHEPAAEEGEIGRAQILLADLNGGKAGGQALADDGDEVPAAGLRAVSDEAEA